MTHPRITLWDWLRSNLRDNDIHDQLTRMETAMANEAEQLTAIKNQLTDVHADVRAKLDQVRAETSPEGQALLDEVKAALESFDSEIGDADGSDTPPVDPELPTEPGTDTFR